MKRIVIILFAGVLLAKTADGYGQGWVAKVDLNVSHLHYAYENIERATLTYSGYTVSDSSRTGFLTLIVNGQGSYSGDFELSINGEAWEPYERTDVSETTITALYNGHHSNPCETGFFEVQGETDPERVFIWIRIYDRIDISSVTQNCDELTLTSLTCSPWYNWEVSDKLSGGFRAISANSPTIKITRDELAALGFDNPFGRKYFRVTGLPNTTSQLQAVDIYYPGPAVTFAKTDPTCFGNGDASVSLEITSPWAHVDSFVATIFIESTEALPVDQLYSSNTGTITFSGLSAGLYRVKIENNSQVAVYGNCWTEIIVHLRNPDRVTVNADIPSYNGFQIPCHGEENATIQLLPAGGTGSYPTFEWIPAVAVTDLARNLSEGVYQVRVQDTHSCWSSWQKYEIRSPERLAVDLISSGGKNGFDVSCVNKTDGEIRTVVSGGVEKYIFHWSNGDTVKTKSNVGPGLYAITVTDANGCVETDSIRLSAPKAIDFTIAETEEIKCAGDSTATLVIQSVVNAIGTISYLWSTGERQKTVTQKRAGTYHAIVSDEQGCSAERSYFLKEPPSYSVEIRTTTDYNGSHIQCFSAENGGLTAVVKDGSGQLASAENYSWFRNVMPWASGTELSSISGLGAGEYRVQVTYSHDCTAEGAFRLVEPEAITVAIINLDSGAGQTNCLPGGLRAMATGGTGSTFDFLWSDGQAGPDRVGIITGTYSVRAMDLNGCEGNVEKVVGSSIDLGGPIVVCRGQTHTLDAGPYWRIYSWSGTNGFRSDARSVILSDEGIYSLDVIDEMGCPAHGTFILETSDDLLNANFLMTSEAKTGDTLVVIDITWPLPEYINWILPDEMNLINDPGDMVIGQLNTSGSFEITMEATLGGCHDKLTKSVVVHESDTTDKGARVTQSILRQFTVFPNPNEGFFNILVDFSEERPIDITIWETLTSKKVAHLRNGGKQSYSLDLDLRPMATGLYTIRLDYGRGTAYLKFIVR